MITRQELYTLIWSTPSSRAAAKLGVSDSYLARICKALDVPKPAPGWWRKQTSGLAPPLPTLPPAKPGFPTFWAKAASGKTGLKQYYRAEPRIIGPPTREVYNSHPLVNRARNLFRAARSSEDNTHLIVPSPMALDFVCSKQAVGNVLLLANTLFSKLNAHGHPVHVAGGYGLIRPELSNLIGSARHTTQWPVLLWAPKAPTVTIVSGVAIGLSILEICEETLMRYVGFGEFANASEVREVAGVTWTEWRRVPTGRLKIIAYSPRTLSSWQQEWTESRENSLARKVDSIIVELETLVAGLPRQ